MELTGHLRLIRLGKLICGWRQNCQLRLAFLCLTLCKTFEGFYFFIYLYIIFMKSCCIELKPLLWFEHVTSVSLLLMYDMLCHFFNELSTSFWIRKIQGCLQDGKYIRFFHCGKWGRNLRRRLIQKAVYPQLRARVEELSAALFMYLKTSRYGSCFLWFDVCSTMIEGSLVWDNIRGLTFFWCKAHGLFYGVSIYIYLGFKFCNFIVFEFGIKFIIAGWYFISWLEWLDIFGEYHLSGL